MPEIITSINEAIANPRRGDCICLDLDELLKLPEHEKKELIKQLTWLELIGIKVVGVVEKTNQTPELNEFAKSMAIVSHDAKENAPSKQALLVKYIQSLYIKPKRVIAINEQQNALEEFKQVADSKTGFPDVILYQHKGAKYQNITRDNSIPEDLEQYDTVEFLGGGTNSTFKITSSKDASLKPLVLKYGASQDAIKLEILCNAIYQFYQVPVPDSKIFNTLPAELAAKLNQPMHGVFQVSEFIAPQQEQNQDAIIASARKDFVLHALLGNIDIAELGNIIQSENGGQYVIDSGSNFIFRALGEFRKEDAKKVTEIDSLKNFKPLWFGDLTNEEIKEQVVKLLSNEAKLEKYVWEVSEKLQLPEILRIEFLQLLSDRIDNLALRFAPEMVRSSKLDRQVEQGETAAGVLTYSMLDGEPVVLLAKRTYANDANNNQIVGLWDCFGGGGDASDSFLHKTAAREVYEESNKKITHAPTALLNSPYHDMITEKNGKPFIYRMYLREHEYVDPSQFSDNEHTEYQWVKLSALEAGINGSSIIDANGKQTVIIKDNEKELALYPEFYQLLKHEVVSENLTRMKQKKPLIASHTQGVSSQPSKQPVGQHFHSPQEMAWQAKRTVLNHLSVIAELKEVFRRKEKSSNENESNANNNKLNEDESESQTELHLRGVLGEKYSKRNIRENINTIIDEMVDNNAISKLDNELKENFISQCESMIQKERQGGVQNIYFYHAVSDMVLFAYEIYSVIHQHLQADPNWKALRFSNEFFNQFSNIEEFIKYYSQSGAILDTHENYQETTLSTNWSLFGNHEGGGESTIEYFLSGKTSRTVSMDALLKDIFANSDFPEVLIQQLIAIYEAHYKNNHAILQIAISRELADSLAYASASFGVLYPYRDTDKLSQIEMLLKNDLDSQDQERVKYASSYLKNMQARLMIPPHKKLDIHRIETRDILPMPESKKLKDFSGLVADLISETVYNAADKMLHSSVPYERIYSMHSSKNKVSNKMGVSKQAIQKAFNKNDINLIESYLKTDSSMASYVLGLSVLGGNTNIAERVINLFPALKDKNIELPRSYMNTNESARSIHLFYAISKQGANAGKLMAACYGQNWPFSLPQNCTHTARTLIVALESLPKNKRMSYATEHMQPAFASDFGLILKSLPAEQRLSYVEDFVNNNSQATVNEMFLSFPKKLPVENIPLIVDFYLEENPEQLCDMLPFFRAISVLNREDQVVRAKSYAGVRPDLINAEDLLNATNHFPSDKKIDFYYYLLTLTDVNLAAKKIAYDWLLNHASLNADQIKMVDNVWKESMILSASSCFSFIEKNKNALLELPFSLEDFQRFFATLSPEQCKIVCEITKDKLTSLIHSPDEFLAFTQPLSPEQFSILSHAYSGLLTDVESIADFQLLLKKVNGNNDIATSERRKSVFDVCKNSLLQIIHDKNDMDAVVDLIGKQQAIELANHIAHYVDAFEAEYQKLPPRANSSSGVPFFQPDFSDKLNKESGSVAKFYLIKKELQNPDSRMAKAAEVASLQFKK